VYSIVDYALGSIIIENIQNKNARKIAGFFVYGLVCRSKLLGFATTVKISLLETIPPTQRLIPQKPKPPTK